MRRVGVGGSASVVAGKGVGRWGIIAWRGGVRGLGSGQSLRKRLLGCVAEGWIGAWISRRVAGGVRSDC